MSNKCRGYYTIKGNGTEALLGELNKRAERHDTEDAIMCYLTPMLRDKGSPDVPDNVYLAGWGNQWPLVIKDGQAEFWAETLLSPPVEALTTLSKLYPVEIELSYSLQENNWEDGKTLRVHEGKVTQIEPDQPERAEE